MERREHQKTCGSSVKIRVHPWLQKQPVSALVRGSAQQLPGEFHPSPPAPLPFQGRGVPCLLSSVCRNTQSSPRPRNGGEGSGVRGQWHPCHRKETRESEKEKTTEPLRFIRAHPCSSVAEKHPASALIRGSAQQLPGEFHPSPPAPLPFQGRGVPCALSSARTNTQSSPRPRNGGEGSGVRGQWHPCHSEETRES